MAKKWLRMIDSAQRQVVLTSVESRGHPGLESLTFEIQGVWVKTKGEEARLFAYADMASRGVEFMSEQPLGILDRLLRKPARIGRLRKSGESLEAVFYTHPSLDLRVHIQGEADAHLWRECEIMMLSAGFYLFPWED